jgi:hypothetical protein
LGYSNCENGLETRHSRPKFSPVFALALPLVLIFNYHLTKLLNYPVQLEREMNAGNLVCFVLAASLLASAQGTPLNLGPLTVTVPPRWNAQANTVPYQLFSPDSSPLQYFQVEFFPPEQITEDVRQHHSVIIGRLSGMLRPGSTPQNGVLGKFIWTRIEIQRAPGQIDTMVLYSAKTGSFYYGITVDATNADFFSRNFPAFETMMRNATLADLGQAPAAVANPARQQASARPASLGEYVYTPPPGWTTQNFPDGIVLTSPDTIANEKCFITILPMRPASANLQDDANSAFRDVWKAYELRTMTNRGTPMPSSITRGTSGQGWDYVIVRRGIGPPGSPESRLGFVFVARLKDQLAVISGLSKDPLVSSCFGELVNNVWPRFFYNLGFKNWTPTAQSAAMRKKIAGVWTMATANTGGQFTFAANGRYGDVAARQQYNRISNSEVLATTQGFFGDGAYTLKGNAITLTPDDRKNHPEPGFIRVEEESKDEGRSWVESLYLLRTSSVDGKEYEVRYQKSR